MSEGAPTQNNPAVISSRWHESKAENVLAAWRDVFAVSRMRDETNLFRLDRLHTRP